MSNVNVNNLKKLVENYIDNRKMARIASGTITSITPLKIKMDNDLELDEDLVTITWADKITSDYLNEKIFLIRQDGGNHYYAMAKITPQMLNNMQNPGTSTVSGNALRVISNNTFLSGDDMDNNAKYIWTYLIDKKGWSEQAAAGLLGNTRVESSHNPGIWEGLENGATSRGFGLVQWTPATIIINYAKQIGKDKGDMDMQLDAIDADQFRHWIPTAEFNFSYSEFKKSTRSPSDLARAFMINYERPANQVQPKRGQYAQEYYDRFKGQKFYMSGETAIQQPTASRYDSSKASAATRLTTAGWDLAEVDRFAMNAADPPHVNGAYIDTWLRTYYPDSPIIGHGDKVKRWSDYFGVSVGAAMGVWAKETTFGRGEPGKSYYNFGCMMSATAPQYPKVFIGDRNWARFPNINVGIGEWFKYVRYRYLEQGITNYRDFLNVYSPTFENNHATFKNLMWGALKAFGYDTSDTVRKANYSKQSDDVTKLNLDEIFAPKLVSQAGGKSKAEKMVNWFEDRVGKVRYSMQARTGPNSYDCSSAVFYAMISAGILPSGTWPGTTETLFGMEGGLLQRIDRSQARRGDIFVSGVPGQSLYAAGHTGVYYGNDQIIHCTYSRNGIAITPVSGYTGSPTRWYRIKGAQDPIPGSQVVQPGSNSKYEQAVQIALQQVGKGYVLGTQGPHTFDCSGLVIYAFRQAGFDMPGRPWTGTMEQQQWPFKAVSQSELRRGDLILYPGHVGIYLGPSLGANNSLVHAATPGLGVITQRANSMNITGYRRVMT